MRRQQLFALFISNITTFFIGNALLPLLPVYVRELGAETSATGIYLGLAFGSLAVGTLASGWLSDRFHRRRLFMSLSAVVSFPALLLMGHVHSMEALGLLLMIVWFAGGINSGMVNILTGLFANAENRGRTFGIISLSHGFAGILGGLVGGPAMEYGGFAALTAVVALSQVVLYITSRMIEDGEGSHGTPQAAAGENPAIHTTLLILLIASTLIYVAHFTLGLARPIAMDDLGFSPAAIASLSVITGIITLPLPVLAGWLSDRFDRKQLLLVCYVAGLAGALVLLPAVDLWHFWVSVGLLALTRAASTIGAALVTDLVACDSLGRQLSYFGATSWYGGVIGYMGAGIIIQSIGLEAVFIISALLPALAIVLTLTVDRRADDHGRDTAVTQLEPAHASQEMPRV